MCAWSGVASLPAQQALYVSDGESAMHLVRKITDGVPYALEKGKLAPVENASRGGFRYALNPAEEFYPVFVQVQNLKTSFPSFNSSTLRQADRRFSFRATLASDYALKNVFLAFEFEAGGDKKEPAGVLARGVATYELADAKPLNVELSLPGETPATGVKLHIFSDGVEVFHSEMPRAMIEEKLAGMAAKRIAKLKDSTARPIAGPTPRYPEKLRKTNSVGRAIVSCEIAINGQPTNLALKSATAPEFGEAALAVMSQWWFLPKVENGHPVPSRAELPFDFAPPKS